MAARALTIPYRGGNVYATPELTCRTDAGAYACACCSRNCSPAAAGRMRAAYMEYALALQSAYRERLQDMGDADGRRALGAEHLAPACTTHFSVVDREGNMAAVTQTLLSTFGSKFVTPQSGVTMNNGIMWFDPTPGAPNSLAPGKRCLTNYTPVLAQAADGRRLALGASGGRRILPAVTQILSFVMDYGMDLDAAIHAPRIDASEGAVVIGDVRLPAPVRDALRAGFDYEEARMQTFPMKFACPSVVLRDGDDQQRRDRERAAVGRAVAERRKALSPGAMRWRRGETAAQSDIAADSTNSSSCLTSSSGCALRAARHIATVPSTEAITSVASRRARAGVTPSLRKALTKMRCQSAKTPSARSSRWPCAASSGLPSRSVASLTNCSTATARTGQPA